VTIRRASIKDLDEIVAIWFDGQLSPGNEPLKLDEAKGIFRQSLESQTDVFGTWVPEINGSVDRWQSLHLALKSPLVGASAVKHTGIDPSKHEALEKITNT
jgi:hypothetical protein